MGSVIMIDAVALSLCVLDGLRFRRTGLELGSAIGLAARELSEGRSIGLATAVLLFFLIALPTAVALLTYLYPSAKGWPALLRAHGKGVLIVHVVLSVTIAISAVVGAAMEVLSGWESAETTKYSFESYWLTTVLFGKPVYVAYISPIIRKLLVRFGANPKHASVTEVAKEVTKEVLTEDRIGGTHE